MSSEEFFDELSEKRGDPYQGEMPLNIIELIGSEKIPMLNYAIDPLTSRTDWYYNTRLNVLYKRTFANKNYAVWRPVNVV